MSEIKNYDRFKELYKDKKYALAYAIAVKYTYLQLTPEYIQMEKNFQISYVNAQKLILLNLPDKAKNQINKYISVISKQKVLQLITTNNTKFKEFLLAYEDNNFRKCYEIMDIYKNIQLIKISILLNDYWDKLINKCLKYADKGDISSIKISMGKLLLVKTRANEISKILKFTFLVKIESLLKEKNYLSCEAIIYFYIDIFDTDIKIKKIKKMFEKNSSITLAITIKNEKMKKHAWRESKLTINFD
ncbi:MAG: hypothetical protein COB17_06980 [Sulfurimonas sp.]|nr:MAG: hypothetical protein COB17_06980 [Sulfurimonas sp.]